MNDIVTKHQDLMQRFKDFLGVSWNDTEFFISGWVSIKGDEIQAQLGNKANLDDASIEEYFIDFVIQKINDSGYGSSCHYELYESRRQETIKTVLARLSDKLTTSEIAYFKQKVGYEEEFKDESGECLQCGQIITALEDAYSCQYVGKPLCSGCCHAEMI